MVNYGELWRVMENYEDIYMRSYHTYIIILLIKPTRFKINADEC